MNKHYRKRTPKQVEDKINNIKVRYTLSRIMSQSHITNYLDRLVQRMARKKRIKIPQGVGKKVRRLERKKRRLEEGKWAPRQSLPNSSDVHTMENQSHTS